MKDALKLLHDKKQGESKMDNRNIKKVPKEMINNKKLPENSQCFITFVKIPNPEYRIEL